jgi:hypothetical protein
LEKEYEDLVQQRLDIMLDRQPKNEQQVPSKQDPFAYVKPEPQGIGDIQDPKAKMAQLAQRTKKGPLANVAAGIKAFVKGEPEPMGEEAQPRTHAQNVYFEILKAWEDERDYIVLPFPNAPNPVTMIRGQIWNAIVDLGSIKDPKRRAKYVEDRFNDFETFMSWLGNLKRYKVPAKKKGKTQSLPLQIPQQPTGQSQPTAPGSPLMDPEFTGIKPPGNLQEKKKSNDLEPKDVGLSRELQKARARFPAAASDLEAGILDQMDQQQQAQQTLSQQQADLNRQDQQIAGLAQANQQQDGVMRTQGQEIDRLTQRLQQVLAQPTATPAAAPVTPQAEPSAPATAPAPDMVYVPDVPADTATQDKEIARLDKQIQQLELMMALKTPAERSDLEARISDLETARAEQEEKKRATVKKSAATRQRNQQATTIDMEPAQAQLGFGGSGEYLDPSAMIRKRKPKPEQGAEVKAAQDVIRKAQKSSRKPQTVAQTVETALNPRDPQGDYAAKRKALQDLGMNKDVDQAAVLQRRLDLDREAKSKGITETVTNVKAGMAEIYRRLAPKIERHRDSFLAGQLYDELENYAELHGAEREFKQMMNSARNRAHMEYDTNPGGFHNWFWFLPFEDENVAEGFEYASKVQHSKYGPGQVVKVYPNGMITVNFPNYPDPVDKKPGVQANFMPGDSNLTLKTGMTESNDDVKKRMSKLEALALAANRAGDDAKCKMYQRKIQSLKQKLSQSMSEGWSDAIVSRRTGQPRTPYSVYINGKKWKDFENDDHARAVMDKLKAKFKADGRDPETITIAPTDMSEAKADPTGSWVVYNGNKVAKFKTHGGAKTYAAKNGGKVASSEFYADRIQKQGVAEAEKEPTTRQELLNRVDKIQRMMTLDRNPANLQILRKELEMLKQRYQHLKEDSAVGEAVEMAIMRRMLIAHTDLIVEFGLDKVVDAIEEVAYNVGDVDEIGSSDVSGWVRQVQQILGADA